LSRGGGVWRLLLDGPADAAWNMAVDEALLDTAIETGRPTVRLYGFRPAALSLGRSQIAASAHDPRFLREQGIDLVRRPTGGLAVLHEHERTYAVVGPLDREPFREGVIATYRSIARALESGLRTFGVAAVARDRGSAPDPRRPAGGAACFATTMTHEIVVAGRKLVGSAQLRRRRAFLQHGSILLRSDPERLARALGAPVQSRFTDLEQELGRATDESALDAALLSGFARTFAATLEPAALDGAERLRAARLRAEKYLSAAWTLEGRAPR